MTNILLPHVFFWATTFIIAVMTAMIIWPRRRFTGGWYLFLFAVCLAEWTLAGTIEAISSSQQTRILLAQIEYVGFNLLVPFAYLFVKRYLSSEQLSYRQIFPVFVLPLITIGLAWTNSFHHLLWSSFEPGNQALNILIFNHGPWFFINGIYIYFLVAISYGLLIKAYLSSQKIFRQQIAAMLWGFAFPLVSGSLVFWNIVPVTGMDVSAMGFAFAGLIIAFAIFRLKFLDLLPIARQMLIDNMRDGVIVVDAERRLVDINPSARKFMLLNPREVIGKPAMNYLPSTLSGLFDVDPDTPVSYEMLAKDQKTYLSIYPIQLNSKRLMPSGTLIVLQDITRRKTAEIKLQESNIQLQKEIQQIEVLQESLRALAIRDPLTNLYNRRYLEETLEREISRAQRTGTFVSVMMIDFDNFKEVNDQYSHLIGDQALQAFAEILKKTSRREDVACRYGGDEFLLILPDLAAEDALKRAETWRKSASDLFFDTPRGRANVTVSIGLASFPQDGTTAEELIIAADQAMYSAKEQGKNLVKQTNSQGRLEGFRNIRLSESYTPHRD